VDAYLVDPRNAGQSAPANPSPTTAYSRSRHRKESRQRDDYYKLLIIVPGDKAYHLLSASECPQVSLANE